MRSKILTLITAVLVPFVFFCGCTKEDKSSLNNYLGDYSYSAPAVCMVFEPVEGETDPNGNPIYGVQYREIKDYDGLVASGNTLLIYFYSSMDNRSAVVTAAMEDLSAAYREKMSIILLDALVYRDLMGKYEIEAVPEFVLIKPGQADKKFDCTAGDYWTIDDVVLWLAENGIS